jgi:8-oxo-dGTP diphosphatase
VKIPRRLRGYGYRAFYRLPGRVRRRLVKIGGPRYSVGAVTVIRTPALDRIVLLRQPPGRGWGLPAGLLKKHEDPAVGAARELFEESGLRLAPADLTPGNPNAIVHTLGWIDLVFFGTAAADAQFTVDGGEVIEARWWPVDALPALTPNTELLLGVYGIGPAAGRDPADSAGVDW